MQFHEVDNSVNKEEMRERVSKVNTMEERDKQTDRHIERKRETVDQYLHNSGSSGSEVVTMAVVMGERDREKRDKRKRQREKIDERRDKRMRDTERERESNRQTKREE